MRFPIPDFVPVPTPETMRIISIVSLAAGIGLVGAAALFLFSQREKEKREILSWIFMGTGVLLILNHAVQLFF